MSVSVLRHGQPKSMHDFGSTSWSVIGQHKSVVATTFRICKVKRTQASLQYLAVIMKILFYPTLD